MSNGTDKFNPYQHIANVQNLFIKHPGVTHCLTKLRNAYHYRDHTGLPKSYLLVGGTGVGKTTIMKTLESEFPPVSRGDRIEYPVLSVTIPSKPTIKNMAEQILIAMGDPAYARGSSTAKTQRIFDLVSKLGVLLFLFDEMQHFVQGGNRNSPRDVADWLKVLIDKSKASTILIGTPPVVKILESNDQLRRRFSTRLELKPFSIKENASAQEFAGIIKHIDEILGLPNRINYRDGSLITSLFFATNGVMDYLIKLMAQAYEIARESGRTQINRETLETAFTEAIWIDGLGKFNPFNDRFVGKSLDFRRGMPFSPDKGS